MCVCRFDSKLTQALEQADNESEQKERAIQENTALGAEIFTLRKTLKVRPRSKVKCPPSVIVPMYSRCPPSVPRDPKYAEEKSSALSSPDYVTLECHYRKRNECVKFILL